MGIYTESQEDIAKSYALRLLIHFVGDIHQPFHSTDRFEAQDPTGDLGGNTFKIPSYMGASNLHSLWDSLIGSQHSNIPRPMDDSHWTALEILVPQMMSRNAVVVADEISYRNFDVMGWANESFEIGITAYQGITENVAVPQSYIDKFVPITEGRVVLAGYRLAHTLQYMFPSTNELFLQ